MAAATEATSSLLDMELNDDVVTEILLRLPSACVLRCRAVCKAWRGISSSPGFVAAYGRRRPLEFIVQRHGANGVLDTLPMQPTLEEVEAGSRCLHPGYSGGGYTLVGSCGDLLLFEGYDRGGEEKLWVCHPVARRWTAVPPPHRRGLTLPCGLYLHRPSGEHRILFLTNDSWSDLYGSASHYVASLQAADAVRRLGPALATVYILSQVITTECLEYQGKLHWLVHPEVNANHPRAKNPNKILAFDTASETFRRMSRPPLLLLGKDHGHTLALLEMDGKLAMTATLDGRMDIWVREDYGDDESWTRRHRIDLPPTLSKVRWALNAGTINVILLADSKSLSVGLYHLTEKRVLKQVRLITNACGPGERWPSCTPLNALVFRDSLEGHNFFNLQKPRIPTKTTDLVLQSSDNSARSC